MLRRPVWGTALGLLPLLPNMRNTTGDTLLSNDAMVVMPRVSIVRICAYPKNLPTIVENALFAFALRTNKRFCGDT